MKHIYKVITSLLLSLIVISCSEDPMEQEQYKKEIYLVGAYNRVWEIDVNYSNEKIESFFTVTSSGTLNLDKDVSVSVEIDESIVETYNRKYLGELNVDKFYEPLDQSIYEIPSMNNITIKHKEGISVNVPIFIQTKELDVDQRYVIPIQIANSSPYDVNPTGKKMLIHLNLINAYSGNYQLDGYMTEKGSNPRRIQKNKILTANGINTVRLFYAMNNESSKKEEITAKTIELTISDEFVEGSTTKKKVSVKGWKDLIITDSGTGTFNTATKEFNFTYTTISNGTVYEEKLTADKIKQ